jgi:predicted metal-dependent hydrolase
MLLLISSALRQHCQALKGGVTSHPTPRSSLVEAARAFNAGRYFEAHEILEDGLDGVPNELWELHIGLIQIAVGYHKVTQQLWSGAARMLQIGLEKISVYPPAAGGVNLEALRVRVRADIEQLRGNRLDVEAFTRCPPRLQPLQLQTRAD